MKDFKLRNGVSIPSIGFGTWQSPNGEVTVSAVKEAIKCGYRHIDTAAAYGNERSVGEAIAQSIREGIVKREDIFITSKLWNTERGYDSTMKAFGKTLNDLQLDYLDLYLIHWPASESQFKNWKEINSDTWKAFEELFNAGKIKAIGVSNFYVNHLKALFETAVIMPMVDQIEYHPGQMQPDVVDFCNENKIVVEAWSPLGSGRLLENQVLASIADKYDKSIAQICIRWILQNGILPLPKSVTPKRIRQNIDVFDFTISDEDMKTIDDMPYIGGSGLNPDKVTF